MKITNTRDGLKFVGKYDIIKEHAELKILEGYGHNDAINKAYEDDYLINWLLGMRRENFDYIPECQEELF